MASLIKSLSSKSSTSSKKSLTSEEYGNNNNVNVENDLSNWNIPRVPIEKVYKKSIFKFNSDSSIKTVEETVSSSFGEGSVQLLKKNASSLRKDRSKYSFLHIGMVQVGVKPLTRQGLDSEILLCVRDCRHLNFQNSLLAMVESSLCHGPIYFNCFPNFTVSLQDKSILDTVTLNFKTSGNDTVQGSLPVVITYGVYYKVMTGPMKPNALMQSPVGETLFFQSDVQNSKKVVSKKVHWNDVQVPSNWINPPPKVEKEPQVIQLPDGNLQVRFR